MQAVKLSESACLPGLPIFPAKCGKNCSRMDCDIVEDEFELFKAFSAGPANRNQGKEYSSLPCTPKLPKCRFSGDQHTDYTLSERLIPEHEGSSEGDMSAEQDNNMDGPYSDTTGANGAIPMCDLRVEITDTDGQCNESDQTSQFSHRDGQGGAKPKTRYLDATYGLGGGYEPRTSPRVQRSYSCRRAQDMPRRGGCGGSAKGASDWGNKPAFSNRQRSQSFKVKFSMPHEDKQQEYEIYKVRQFSTTSKGIVTSRGESFKIRRSPSHTLIDEESAQIAYGSSSSSQNPPSRSPSLRSSGMHPSHPGLDVAEAQPAAEPDYYRVFVWGKEGVGKTSIKNQLLTSEYLANSDGRCLLCAILCFG